MIFYNEKKWFCAHEKTMDVLAMHIFHPIISPP